MVVLAGDWEVEGPAGDGGGTPYLGHGLRQPNSVPEFGWLATIVRFQFKLDPYDKNTLFLFCGRRCDRIKALLWEGDGFLLMYKRLDNGAFRWPRSADEAMAITDDQYRMLMQGLEIVARHPISELKETPRIM